jgi:hypothetical protein
MIGHHRSFASCLVFAVAIAPAQTAFIETGRSHTFYSEMWSKGAIKISVTSLAVAPTDQDGREIPFPSRPYRN